MSGPGGPTRRGRRRAVLLAVVATALLVLSGCTGATRAVGATAGADPSSSPTGTLRVVGLGDSVMAGTNCDCDGIVKEYAAGLGARTGRRVTTTDLSEGGLVTGDVDQGLEKDPKQQQALREADVVLVTIGANDLYPALDKWRASSCDAQCYDGVAARMGSTLSDALDKIESLVPPHAQVLVTDYWNVFTDGAMTRRSAGQAQIDFSEKVTAAANTQICRAATSHSARCVDLLVPFKGDSDHPRDPTPLLADDGDHPNADGVKVIVAALLGATRTP